MIPLCDIKKRWSKKPSKGQQQSLSV